MDDSPAAHASTAAKDRSRQNILVPDAQVDAPQIVNPTPDGSYKHPTENRTTIGFDDILVSNTSVVCPPGALLDQEQLTHIQDHSALATSSRTLTRRPSNAKRSLETDLLRHFGYHVAPWIDTGDTHCAFGVQALLLSRSSRPLQAAILAISARQRSLFAIPSHLHDLSAVEQFCKEAETSLSLQPDLLRHAGYALLLLQDILPSGLQQWRYLIQSHVQPIYGLLSPSDLNEKLGEALFWLIFRLGMFPCVGLEIQQSKVTDIY